MNDAGQPEAWEWQGGIFLSADSWTRADITAVNEKIDSQKAEVDAAKDDAMAAISVREQEVLDNFNAQRVTPDMLSESTKQLINASGGGTITNLPDDEDIESVDIGDIQTLKFKDRAYNASGFSGLGYKILRKNVSESKNILTQDMMNAANTVYEIRYDFDLNGATITVPEKCILKFVGGSLSNGTISGNNTELSGNVKIGELNGTFSGTVRTSYSILPANFLKLKLFLSLNVGTLIIDEDFTISAFSTRITTNIPSIIGRNALIDIQTDITVFSDGTIAPEYLIVHNGNVKELSGISFNFNGHASRGAFIANNTADAFVIKDIEISGINNRSLTVGNNYWIYGIYLPNAHKGVIDNLKIGNLSSLGNTTVGDSTGNISALFVSASADAQVTISNVFVYDIHNYTAEGEIYIEDSNGIFVQGNFVQLYINNVYGSNYGKRLIKIQASNTIVENIIAVATTDDSLCVVGFDSVDGQYNTGSIRNVFFKGYTQFVVSVSMEKVIVNDILVEKTINNNNLMAVLNVSADYLSVDGVTTRGGIQMIVEQDDTYGRKNDISLSNLAILDGKINSAYTKGIIYPLRGRYSISSIHINSSWLSEVLSNRGALVSCSVKIDNMIWDDNEPSWGYILPQIPDKDIYLEINNSIINFNNKQRAIINAGAKCSICFRNVTVNWNYDVNFTENENQRQGIPFGSVELSDTNKITIQGVRVNNNSDVAFALYDFYITNSRSEGGLTNNLFISDYQNCDPLSENHPMGQGISSSSNNVIWKGGALLRFANYANTTLDKYYSGLRLLAGDYSLRQWTGSKWVDATGTDA